MLAPYRDRRRVRVSCTKGWKRAWSHVVVEHQGQRII